MHLQQVAYRYTLVADPVRNIIFAGNGNLLEIYSLIQTGSNKHLKLINTIEIVPAPLVVSHISVDDSYVVVAGGSNLSVLEEVDGEFTIRWKHNVGDNIAAAKFLKCDSTVVAVTKKKHFYSFVRKEDGFELVRRVTLEPVTTIFSAYFIGDSLESLQVITGGIFGEIESFKLGSEPPERLFSLKGHDGMVFGIHITPTHIFSIGDDRALRIFTLKDGEEQFVAYGHQDRIRGLCVDLTSDPLNPYVYTAGDTTAVWKYDTVANSGHLIHQYESATGKVMAIAIADGCLIGCSAQGALFNVEALRQQMEFVESPELGVVRSFAKGRDSTYYVVDDKKDLKYRKINDELSPVDGFQGLKLRYNTLMISPNGKTIITSGDSVVYVIDAATLTGGSQFQMADVLGGVCLVGNSHLLAVSRQGKAVMVELSTNSFTNFHIEKGLPIKCAITNGPFMVIGTGRGYVSLYDEDTNMIIDSICVAAKKDVVVDLIWDSKSLKKTHFYALTRDGKCSLLTILESKALELVETWSTIRTPAGFLSPRNPSSSTTPYIWGFRGPEFVVTSLKGTNPLIVFECGGGNRIMSVFPTFEGDDLTTVRFEYIVRGELKVVEGKIPKANFAMGPFHKSEIYGAVEVNREGETPAIVTVGVDTQVILSKLSDNGLPLPVCRNFTHLSSIHCVEVITVGENTYIVTAGGRSEVRLWQVLPAYLNSLAGYEGTPDYRVVSVKVREDAGKLFIFAATSIRELQAYSFDLEHPTNQLKKIYAFKCPDQGTFGKVASAPDFSSIFAVGTSGTVYALKWPQSEANAESDQTEPVYRSQRPNEAGTLGLCAVPASVPRANDIVIMGDDGGSVYVVDLTATDPLLKIEDLHFSQISDMVTFSVESDPSRFRLASVSSEGVLAITAISNDFSSFEKLISKPLCVGDPMSLRLTRSGFLVAGEGLQAIRFDELGI
uniref:tRNA (34-2'-O)-methyltransferase regulator WDR6 n=1 Tax=Panagrellus redivivus TaxID=6233 RepID=A0A7E4ZW16_PANRE